VGNTIWLQVKREGKVTGGDRDNSLMLRLEKELDTLADQLGVARPSSFYGWRDPEQGLATISALLRALQENPARVEIPSDPSRAHWPELLFKELTYCESNLKAAADEGCRFRFRVVS
jgi:hypothetical protein